MLVLLAWGRPLSNCSWWGRSVGRMTLKGGSEVGQKNAVEEAAECADSGGNSESSMKDTGACSRSVLVRSWAGELKRCSVTEGSE